MAITNQQREHLVALTTLMFDAPPGAAYLEVLGSYLEEGQSLTEVATTLANTELFNSRFSRMATNEQKIDVILPGLGLEPGSSAYDAAYQFFDSSLEAGRDLGDIFVEAGTFLYNTHDAAFQTAVDTFANKIEVGVYYSAMFEGNTNNVERLQNTIAYVTEDPASVQETIQAFNSPVTANFTVVSADETLSVTGGEVRLDTSLDGNFYTFSRSPTELQTATINVEDVSAIHFDYKLVVPERLAEDVLDYDIQGSAFLPSLMIHAREDLMVQPDITLPDGNIIVNFKGESGTLILEEGSRIVAQSLTVENGRIDFSAVDPSAIQVDEIETSDTLTTYADIQPVHSDEPLMGVASKTDAYLLEA